VDSDKLPPVLAEIVKKCVKPDPVERYFSAAELLADLEKAGAGGRKAEDGGRKSAATGAETNACPACGKNNAENVKFCVGCGAGLTQPCPECGGDTPIHSPFCGACGTDAIGSARFRDGVTQMEKFVKERQWGRVLKEHVLLPVGARMPGAKGRELVQRAARLKETADKALAARKSLRKTVDSLSRTGQWKDALAAARAYLEDDTGNAEAVALVADLERRVAAEEAGKALAARKALRKTIDSMFNAGQWKDALAKARVYLEGDIGNDEVVALVADLEKRVAAEEAGKVLAARAALRKTVDSLSKAGQWKDALAKARVYLEGDTGNAEAVVLVEELEKRVAAEEWESVKAKAGRLEDAVRLRNASEVICSYACDHAGGFYGSEVKAERIRLERLMVLHGDVNRMCQEHDFAGANKAVSAMERTGFSAAGAAAVRASLKKEQSIFETGRRLRMLRVVRKGAALAAVVVGLALMSGAVSCAIERNRAQRVSRLWVEAQSAKDAKDWGKMIAAADSMLLIRHGNPQLLALRQEAMQQAKADADAETARLAKAETAWQAKVKAEVEVARLAKEKADTEAATNAAKLRASQAMAETQKTKLRAEPEVGDVETVDLGNGVKLELVWCPAGSFLMGSPEGESDRGKDETQHQVTLKKGFWMGMSEVTQRQWEAVVGSKPRKLKGANLPVENVSWDDCQAFVRKLNAKAGGGRFRLPTEAEWEYACRAGSTGPYAGDLSGMGWYYDNSEKMTHAVGQKRANAWGLYDMHGNVSEWCQDWYGDYPVDSVTDPSGLSSGVIRVCRGGCWNVVARDCRSASRGWGSPVNRFSYLGLRLARDRDDEKQLTIVTAKQPDSDRTTVQNAVKGTVKSEAWTSPAAGMEFVWVSALKIWVGKYEVTNGEYRKKESRHNSKDYQGYSLNDDRQPVVQVDFDDAKAYAAWLTERDKGTLNGLRYRVISEQEWLTCVQCGDGREYPWGNSMTPLFGNYCGQESKGKFGTFIADYNDGFLVSCPVEKSGVNPWKLYGVGGNVGECCAADVSGMTFGAWRGGSWYCVRSCYLQCKGRFLGGGTLGLTNCGFRLVLSR
jgi:formylglycine-generating enzyme required for sulfatase activity